MLNQFINKYEYLYRSPLEKNQRFIISHINQYGEIFGEPVIFQPFL